MNNNQPGSYYPQANTVPTQEVVYERPKSVFTGGLAGFVGHSILAFLITALTLGFAYPWAVVHLMRWEVKHTYIDGYRLVFTGTAMGLFVQWIKWFLLTIITIGIYGFWLNIKLTKWKVSHTHLEMR